jgi:hypothetical protein
LNNPQNGNTKNATTENYNDALLSVSYTMTTSGDYETGSTKIAGLNLALLNPSSEKQEITMALFEDGQMDIIIEEKSFTEKTNVQHQILPDPFPKIVKTVITGNTIKFYDASGKLLNTENIPIPNHSELVKTIKEIGSKSSPEEINEVIATMQGHQLIGNLEEFIKDLEDNILLQKSSSGSPITIIEQGENYVTLRMPLNNVEQAMNQESVLLIDKTLNKIVGTRIYDQNNQLLQSTFFGYNNGEVKSLNAIKTTQKVQLPSGDEVDMISYSKIDDMQFNLNL